MFLAFALIINLLVMLI